MAIIRGHSFCKGSIEKRSSKRELERKMQLIFRKNRKNTFYTPQIWSSYFKWLNRYWCRPLNKVLRESPSLILYLLLEVSLNVQDHLINPVL